MSEYDLVLKFDTDGEEFIRGFEAGRIWETLRGRDVDQLDGQMFHSVNAEMMIRMLEALDLSSMLRADIVDDRWMVLRKISP